MSTRQQVCVVTGGGGGIGAAIAEELGRDGWFVVTVDPLVTLDGTETLPAPEQTTAGRIVAAGGSAQASAASVTDGDALRCGSDYACGSNRSSHCSARIRTHRSSCRTIAKITAEEHHDPARNMPLPEVNV